MTTLTKGKTFKAQFIRAGVVKYDDETILVREENLHMIANSFEGVPVIVGHEFITENNVDDLKVGICGKANLGGGFNGFKDIDIIIDDDRGLQAINAGFSVSCSLKPTKTLGSGTYNNVPYDREVTEAQGLHMALVEEPRYEEAVIFENSKSSKDKEKDNNIIKASMFKLFNNSKKNKEMDLENTNILIGEKTFKASEVLENSKDGKSLILKSDIFNNEGDKDKEDKDKKDNQGEKGEKGEKDKAKGESDKADKSSESTKSDKAKDNEHDDDDDKKDNTGDHKGKMFKVNGKDRTEDEVLRMAAAFDKKDNEKEEDKEEKSKDNSISGAMRQFYSKGAEAPAKQSNYIAPSEQTKLAKKLM